MLESGWYIAGLEQTSVVPYKTATMEKSRLSAISIHGFFIDEIELARVILHHDAYDMELGYYRTNGIIVLRAFAIAFEDTYSWIPLVCELVSRCDSCRRVDDVKVFRQILNMTLEQKLGMFGVWLDYSS